MLTGIELALYLAYIFVGIMFTERMCDTVEKQYPLKCGMFVKLTVFLIYPLLLSYIIFTFIFSLIVFVFTGKLPNK